MRISAKPYLQRINFHPNANLDFDDYPYNIPAIQDLESITFHKDVTFFVGENGSGKSTLLEALAMSLGFSPEGGTKNVQLSTTEHASSSLHQNLRLIRSFKKPKDNYFLRAESFYNVATYMDGVGISDSYGINSLHKCSHGEAFMSLFTHKLRGNGLYLFDEPEAALSPNRQLAALKGIDELVKQNSQFIIVTHSPILLAYPNAKIYLFDQTGISNIAYEDTEHFAVTRDFLNHYPFRVSRILQRD